MVVDFATEASLDRERQDGFRAERRLPKRDPESEKADKPQRDRRCMPGALQAEREAGGGLKAACRAGCNSPVADLSEVSNIWQPAAPKRGRRRVCGRSRPCTANGCAGCKANLATLRPCIRKECARGIERRGPEAGG